MNPITRLWWTAKAVGWDNVPRRLLQAWRVKSGSLRRRTDPARFTDEAFQRACSISIDQQPARWHERAKRFLPVPTAQQLHSIADDSLWNTHVTAVCQQALTGQYPFFSRGTGALGWPPKFNRDPLHAIDWPVGEHWTRTARSGPPRHDIKLVWESNRLALAYHLARAYRRSADDRWSAAFWDMFDAWLDQNPVQQSVAWGCGQEIAFRLMAMLTASFATLESPHATPARLYALSRLAWQSAQRIEVNINYAISQENNHALSEAQGLWTVGLLFPEFPTAERWKSIGRHVLATQCRRQIYDDGSFVQHSLNYHRVMLDDLMWSVRLGEINSDPLPDTVLDRFRRATEWLEQIVDPSSGRVPNYGANDGANVLPLSCTDYLDYRPALQAAHWIAHRQRCLAPGPWDEKLLWLCGADALAAPTTVPPRLACWSAPLGGYHILRGPHSWLLTRCGTYKDRPHQADMLHVDLWCQGHNVLRDAGSFLYYDADPRWQHFFHSTAAHNTVEIDGLDQMVRGPRFLWFRWPSATLMPHADGDEASTLAMHNHSYRWLNPPVTHHRTIQRDGDHYTIRDLLSSSGPHTARIRWRLIDTAWQPDPDQPYTWTAHISGLAIRLAVQSESPLEVAWHHGNESLPAGWESLDYGQRTPAPTLVATFPFEETAELTTRIELTNDH